MGSRFPRSRYGIWTYTRLPSREVFDEHAVDGPKKLRLFKLNERIEALLQDATTPERGGGGEEGEGDHLRTQLARFPYVKTLDAFDFKYQPSLYEKQIRQMASCRYIDNGDNVVLLGPPGVGKTRIAVALGLKAIELGYRLLFVPATALIASPAKAHSENRLEGAPEVLLRPEALDRR